MLHVLTHSFPTRCSSDLEDDAPINEAAAISAVHLHVAHFPVANASGRQVLPVSSRLRRGPTGRDRVSDQRRTDAGEVALHKAKTRSERSEEHTSELQSLMRTSYAVLCLNKTN